MILGRPTNLWLGLVASGAGVAAIVLIAGGLDPEFVAQLLGALVTFLGAMIALIAGQPATINAGDRINVHTGGHQLPSVTTKVDVTPSGKVVTKDEQVVP